MKKNSNAQICGPGIKRTALGNATNESPGPDVATSSTSAPIAYAKNPRMANTVKPAYSAVR